jgi:hypothetical protein
MDKGWYFIAPSKTNETPPGKTPPAVRGGAGTNGPLQTTITCKDSPINFFG